MQIIEVSEKSISNMRLRLSLDYISWISATIALWLFAYPTAAAFIGATGIMYLRWATRRFVSRKNTIREILAEQEAILKFIADDNQDAMENLIKKLDENGTVDVRVVKADDIEDWLAGKTKEDDEDPKS